MSPGSPDSNDRLDWLRRSFDEWDAHEPSAGVWEDLDESLSVEAVWSRVDESLLVGDHAEDTWIAASHEAWNPGNAPDGWARLNEAISLETVWTDLNQTLSHPVATRMPYWKMIAASLVALFVTQQLSDMPVVHQRKDPAPALAQLEAITGENGSSSGTSSSDPVAGDQAVVAAPAGHPEHLAAVRQNSPPEQRTGVGNPASSNEGVSRPAGAPAVSTAGVSNALSLLEGLPVLADVTIGPLAMRSPDEVLRTSHDVYARDFRFRTPQYHWTVGIGTQLSVLQEREQSLLTSTAPRFGLAADLSYTHRYRSLQFIHSVGVSQYSQETGKYLNGRFTETDQQVNALQLSSCVGYRFERFTFYGGVLLSKVLSGLEQENLNQKVLGVYSFSEIQPGATGGVDYRITSFPRTGRQLSVGAQYQWMPSLQSKKNSFEHIQGVRLQAKFSF